MLFKCSIKYCAHEIELAFGYNLMDQVRSKGWVYVISGKRQQTWICPECWEQSGLKWRDK